MGKKGEILDSVKKTIDQNVNFLWFHIHYLNAICDNNANNFSKYTSELIKIGHTPVKSINTEDLLFQLSERKIQLIFNYLTEKVKEIETSYEYLKQRVAKRVISEIDDVFYNEIITFVVDSSISNKVAIQNFSKSHLYDYIFSVISVLLKEYQNDLRKAKNKYEIHTGKVNLKVDLESDRYVLDSNLGPQALVNQGQQQIEIRIDELIKSVDVKGWQKFFFNIEDYDKYKSIISNFFIDPNYEIPAEIIQTKPKVKSSIISIFKSLHDYHSPLSGHMKDDMKFISIVKLLKCWQDENVDRIFKRISSNSIK